MRAVAIALGVCATAAPGALAAPHGGMPLRADELVAPMPSHTGQTATAAARGRIYAGTTSERDPIVLGLAKSGRRVSRISLQIAASCTGGGPGVALFVNVPAALTVRGSGRFAGSDAVDVSLASGDGFRGEVIVKGTITGRRMKGSVVAEGDLADPAGTVVDRCEQRFTFTARSGRGRFFGGVTSQGAPVTLAVRDGAAIDEEGIRLSRTVRTLAIGWRAPWSDGGMAQIGERLVNFPVRDGRFGDVWTFEFDEEDGSRNAVDYVLDGMIGERSTTGSFHALWTHVDPAGVESSADTGPVTFRATSG
jgi:hypothetical protein